jgi:hypothetical protein
MTARGMSLVAIAIATLALIVAVTQRGGGQSVPLYKDAGGFHCKQSAAAKHGGFCPDDPFGR